jgi:hypothetical protein
MEKFSLIDLELQKWTTGGKRKQPERLSERTRKGCDSLNIGITKEADEGTRRGTPLERVVTKLKSERSSSKSILDGSFGII